MSDRYKITELLGEDVLGAVHLADDTMLQRRVMVRSIEHGDTDAAKKRDDKWRKKFAAYTGKMSTMQHPNLLTIYDVSVDDVSAKVVNQYVEGEFLGDRLERGPISELGVYRIASDMLEALHAAHESDVFHGALHTGSVRRVHRASGGHRCLLVDLGLNQLASMIKGDQIQVADPVLLAPELHDGDKKPDAKADLFMLGQLCYTALVGGHPYSDKTEDECEKLYKSEEMPHISVYVEDINPDFAEWIMKMVEGDPAKRPQDTADAMVLLAAVHLNEPEPNVPGETHAVEGVSAENATVPQVVASAHPTTMGTATVSVHIAAANSARKEEMAMSQSQMINSASNKAVLDRESKEKRTMMIVIGALVLALIAGGIVIAVNTLGGKDVDSVVGDGEDSSVTNQYSVEIMDAELIHPAELERNPKKVELDDTNMVDWLVSADIPIKTGYIVKNGNYFLGVDAVKVDREHRMVFNPIRFVTGNELILPRASITWGGGARVDSGYEIQVRIPEEDPQSVSFDVYIVQKECDVSVSLQDLSDTSVTVKEVLTSVRGIFKVPVRIYHPMGGENYTIKVLLAKPVTETSDKGRVQFGLSGVLVNRIE